MSNYIEPFIRYELKDRVIVHSEKWKCGKNTHWLEIEGRTDDILNFKDNIMIAPMSFYKILEEVKEIKRFQLVQRSINKLELRIVSDNKDEAFLVAKNKLQEFLNSKNITNVEILLSTEPPQANKISGKYNHIYKDFEWNKLKQ